MKLSKEIVEYLKIAGDSSKISEECFHHILCKAVASILGMSFTSPVLDELLNTQSSIKGAYGALLVLLVEASRLNLTPDSLGTALQQEYSFNAKRCSSVMQSYSNNKNKIRAALSHIGQHPPHVTDVRWEMDYCVKVSSLDLVREASYNIQLEVERCQGKTATQGNTITFSCSVGELQNLVWKLKEAVKHLERISLK
ncbi:COMM domain-containing protein 3-like [Schistocerca serialis cubense]|uniref:COMM domain-containing protein 3-like n=1 Tax=Schistocerca serialis cubense TaxID=2023355 RepID=UPI00214E8C25|nr:COMM domain-containing protein 3-like [Schistocerca serialis cubense]